MSEKEFKFGQMVVHDQWGECVFIRYADNGGHRSLVLVTNTEDVFYCQPGSVTTPTPPPNTVPVRIAVVVGSDGCWYSPSQFEDTVDQTAIERCGVKHGDRIAWITAHVPLPDQPAEVAGTVDGHVTNPPTSRASAEDSEQCGGEVG